MRCGQTKNKFVFIGLFGDGKGVRNVILVITGCRPDRNSNTGVWQTTHLSRDRIIAVFRVENVCLSELTAIERAKVEYDE